MAARGARAAGGASRRIRQWRVARCALCCRGPQGPQRALAHLRPTSFSIAASWCGSTPSAFITALMIESDRMSSSVGSDWQQFTTIRFLAVLAAACCGCNGLLPEECYSTGVERIAAAIWPSKDNGGTELSFSDIASSYAAQIPLA